MWTRGAGSQSAEFWVQLNDRVLANVHHCGAAIYITKVRVLGPALLPALSGFQWSSAPWLLAPTQTRNLLKCPYIVLYGIFSVIRRYRVLHA